VGDKDRVGKSEAQIVEVTTFRIEASIPIKRHPDEVTFAKTIEEDLSRRDFTVNAMALSLNNGEEIVDPYGGRMIESKIIRTVGKSEERFSEDALRLMRAVRLRD